MLKMGASGADTMAVRLFRHVSRRAGSAALLVPIALVTASSASAAPTASPVTGLSSAPSGLARLSDDAVWATFDAGDGELARFSADGSSRTSIAGGTSGLPRGISPAGLIAGQSGQAWFFGRGSDKLGRLNISSRTVDSWSLTGGDITSLALAGSTLWMPNDFSLLTDEIARVDTVAQSRNSWGTGLSSSSNPGSITLGPDGGLWFTVADRGKGVLGRISTTGSVTFPASGRVPGSLYSVLAKGPDGALWTAAGREVGPFSMSSAPFATAPSAVRAMAAGPDGAMWAGFTGGLMRVLNDGSAQTFNAGLDPAAAVTGLQAGSDDRVWASLDRSPWLVRVTVPPTTGAATASPTSATSADVDVEVDANGLLSQVEVEVRNGAAWTSAGTVDGGDSTSPMPVRLQLSGLPAGTTTDLRITATSAAGSAVTTTTVTTPAPTPSPTPAPTPTPTPAPTPTPTPTPTAAPTPTPTPTPTAAPTPTSTPAPTPPTPTPAVLPTPTPSATATPRPAASVTPVPKPAPSPTSTLVPEVAPAPTPAPAPTGPVAVPVPVEGETLVVEPSRGTVRYRVPGSANYRELEAGAIVPAGTVVDTSKGEVQLTSSVGDATQDGSFWGGKFRADQRDGGMTQVLLADPLACDAPGISSSVRGSAAAGISSSLRSAARASSETSASRAGKKRKKAKRRGKTRRHVWGRDRGGRFETHGRDSVATVRGTVWLTTDTCTRTVVKVFEGAVEVTPKRPGARPVLVKAGEKHTTRHAS